MRKLIIALIVMLWAAPASGQSVYGDRFIFTSGPRQVWGTGSPEGAVTAVTGSTYHDMSAAGKLWIKVTSTGNTGWVALSTTTGTVTSVGLAMPSQFTVTNSPVTTSGTLTAAWNTQTAGTIFAGPASGSAATPTFTSAPKASTSFTTPLLYGTPTIALGGTGIGGCTTFLITSANCEPLEISFDGLGITQRNKMDTRLQSRWTINTDGMRLGSYNTTGSGYWLPAKISGAPVQVEGGGFHLGGTNVSDPGLGNALIDGWLHSSNPVYASQATGMAIDFTDGSIDAQYITVKEFHALKFIADVEIALLGGVDVTKSQAKVSLPFTTPSKGSISVLAVKDIADSIGQQAYESGDTVMVRTFSRSSGGLTIGNACGVVTGYHDNADGTQTWNFQRYLSTDGGAMTDGTVLPTDALVLDYGVSGDGYYRISAADGSHAANAPYAETVRWVNSPCNSANLTVTTRTGNLKGITGTKEYGALLGTYGTASAGQYVLFSDQHAELHNVPLSLYSGTNQTLYLNPTNASFSQAASAASSLTSSSGVGSWSGISGGCFISRLGDPAGQNMSFNSCTGVLALTGAITVSGTLPDANNALALVGTAGATVVNGAALATTGLDSNGNPLLPHTSTPSGTGLFLGSDYIGYYTGGAWTNYWRNNGDVRFGGSGGALQFTGSTGALVITATLSGDGSGVTAINGGNITTGTVTATQIAANTITAAKIAAGTITTTELNFTPATSTNVIAKINASAEGIAITADRVSISGLTTFSAGYDPTGRVIAGGAAADVNANVTTISGGKITANSITASQITAATITTTEIAATTITASNLNISTLSAITANLGSVTAGSIVVGSINKLWLNDGADGALAIGGSTKASAPTQISATGYLTSNAATFGGGSNGVDIDSTGMTVHGASGHITAGGATLTSSGLQLTAGAFFANQINWSDGTYIGSSSGSMSIVGAYDIHLTIGSLFGEGIAVNATTLATSGLNLGSGWLDGVNDAWITGTAHIYTVAGGPYVCADVNGVLSGCTAHDNELRAEVAQLRRELSELRQLIARGPR